MVDRIDSDDHGERACAGRGSKRNVTEALTAWVTVNVNGSASVAGVRRDHGGPGCRTGTTGRSNGNSHTSWDDDRNSLRRPNHHDHQEQRDHHPCLRSHLCLLRERAKQPAAKISTPAPGAGTTEASLIPA